MALLVRRRQNCCPQRNGVLMFSIIVVADFHLFVLSAGRDDLEAGDKILLPTVCSCGNSMHYTSPHNACYLTFSRLQHNVVAAFALQSAFKEITRLKLPFPLTFQLHNDKAKSAGAIPDKTGVLPPVMAEQYAGVLEFSAPEGQAYLPSWMMTNLKLRESNQVRITSVRDVRALQRFMSAVLRLLMRLIHPSVQLSAVNVFRVLERTTTAQHRVHTICNFGVYRLRLERM